jgi:hypothetical protein
MKFYTVYECEGYTFKWWGGSIIDVFKPVEDARKKPAPAYAVIEHYEEADNNAIKVVCLEWLVEEGVITGMEMYL